MELYCVANSLNLSQWIEIQQCAAHYYDIIGGLRERQNHQNDMCQEWIKISKKCLLSPPKSADESATSLDITAPTYYFLVPSGGGKVRDCTFIFYEAKKCYYILIMSSLAFIYCEMLNDASSAKQGSFYVTNTLDVASNCNPETGSTRIVWDYYSAALCKVIFFFHLFNLKKVI